MVNASLAGAHPLRNSKSDDVSCLTDIFHLMFQHYTLNSSPMAATFIQSLRSLVGLGLTLCLADETYCAWYQPYFNCFLKYDRGNFQKHPYSTQILANNIANMVILATKSFQASRCSIYSCEFIKIIKKILENVMLVEVGKKKEAKKILKWLKKEKNNVPYSHL